MRSLALALLCAAGAACGRSAPVVADAAPAPRPPLGWPAWACRMGPLTGATGLEPVVAPGEYRAAFRFTRRKFMTMERSFSETHLGATSLTLEKDGTLRGCIGMDRASTSSVSRYESPDKQDHTYNQRYRQLFGFAGRWEAAADGIRLILDGFLPGRCAGEQMSPMPGFQLVCAGIPANQRLPVGALVCRSLNGLHQTEEIALDLGENRRAGPWAMRHDAIPSVEEDRRVPCGPWILFGAAPGLHVTSEEDAQDKVPTVTFTAGAPPFVENDFIEPKADAGPSGR